MSTMTTDFNFKDFFLKESVEEAVEKGKEKAAKKVAAPTYTVEWVSGPDFIISRKTARTESFLCILVSQEQYYIKNKEGDIQNLTVANLTEFLSKADTLTVNASWIKTLSKGKNEAAVLLSLFKKHSFKEIAKGGYTYMETNTYSASCDFGDAASLTHPYLNIIKKMQDAAESLYDKEYRQEVWQAYRGAPRCRLSGVFRTFMERQNLDWLVDRFGESGASQLLIEALNILPIGDVGHSYGLNDAGSINSETIYKRADHILATEFRFESFKQYVLYEPIRQGFAMNSFIQAWDDCLGLQMEVKGRIEDKYPEHLSSYHDKLSFQSRILKVLEAEEDRVKMNETLKKRTEALKKHCGIQGNYIFSVPETVQDVLNEASNQANCLASYLSAYVDGTTDLYFMRRKDSPDASYITIEIRGGGLRQAYGYHNSKPSQSEMECIHLWCEKNGFAFNSSYRPMGV